VILSLILDEHRKYLIDRPRISAFERAIPEVIRPGDVVLDLGSGTAILGSPGEASAFVYEAMVAYGTSG
jgi:predicted RNA methylase